MDLKKIEDQIMKELEDNGTSTRLTVRHVLKWIEENKGENNG